ncbi:MAG TPA: methyltransferase domain-containing protein [Terriglobia bacterium]|nr:methyltransferase domain-containing protein [Terriglobia bacterium]
MFLYKLRHPEVRLEEKLSRLSRNAIEGFLDNLSRDALLTGNILEVGAGGREHNKRRFKTNATNYWRSDFVAWPQCKLDLFCDFRWLPFRNCSLDGLICSEVLEHTPHFFQAVAEMTRVLKPGGHFVLTMPFFFPIHGADEKRGYGDFWRLTPANLKICLEEDYDLVRENTANVFFPGDPFVVGIQMLWRRKREMKGN